MCLQFSRVCILNVLFSFHVETASDYSIYPALYQDLKSAACARHTTWPCQWFSTMDCCSGNSVGELKCEVEGRGGRVVLLCGVMSVILKFWGEYKFKQTEAFSSEQVRLRKWIIMIWQWQWQGEKRPVHKWKGMTRCMSVPERYVKLYPDISYNQGLIDLQNLLFSYSVSNSYFYLQKEQ